MAKSQPFGDLDLGLVVAAHGRHFIVEDPEGKRITGHPRGKKSDCVVGDRVRWLPTGASSGDEGVIEHIEPRRNLLLRQDEWRSKAFAANLDQVLILVAGEPMFSESQLARALIAAEHAGISAHIVLNKIDLPAATVARERLEPYVRMGVPLLEVALKKRPDEARAAFAPLLAGATSLILGPSGTGKSTLINLMVPSASAQVGEISHALGSGRHTTTTTSWYWVERDEARGADFAGSALIDSPGFQQFGLRQVDARELALLMPDLRAQVEGCRFYNCMHADEPGCAVRAAVEAGTVSASRWRIYREIVDELARTKW